MTRNGGAQWLSPYLAPSALAAIWQGNADATFAMSQATHALTLMVAALAGEPEMEWWFPDYFCENGLGPIRSAHARLRFYPVTEALTPDWPACRRMLELGRPQVFTLPHFFGVVNETATARAFCDEAGALLHEDAAHVLRPVGDIGKAGDFVTYSPRKYFDIPDAGILVVRGGALVERVAATAATLPPSRMSALPWRLSHAWSRLRPRPVRTGPMPPRAIADDPPVISLLPALWISKFSLNALADAAAYGGFEEVAQREGSAIAVAQGRLSGAWGLAPLDRHPLATPYFLALRGGDERAVAEAFRVLRQVGALVNTWPGLPPEVMSDPVTHRAALQVRRTLLRFTMRREGRRRPLDFIEPLDGLVSAAPMVERAEAQAD